MHSVVVVTGCGTIEAGGDVFSTGHKSILRTREPANAGLEDSRRDCRDGDVWPKRAFAGARQTLNFREASPCQPLGELVNGPAVSGHHLVVESGDLIPYEDSLPDLIRVHRATIRVTVAPLQFGGTAVCRSLRRLHRWRHVRRRAHRRERAVRGSAGRAGSTDGWRRSPAR